MFNSDAMYGEGLRLRPVAFDGFVPFGMVAGRGGRRRKDSDSGFFGSVPDPEIFISKTDPSVARTEKRDK